MKNQWNFIPDLMKLLYSYYVVLLPKYTLTKAIVGVRQLGYVAYVRMPTFIGVRMILDMFTLTGILIFSLWFFKVFKVFNFILFKNLLLYIWPLIYLFVLGRDIFFTAYICFKETFFYNFSYNLINKYFSLPQSTCQLRLPVGK